MTMKHYILAMVMAGCAMPLWAQSELRGSVEVEGRYLPDVIRQDRIFMRPTRANFSLASTPLNYEYRGLEVNFTPSYLALPALGWNDNRKPVETKGYVDLMAGSWLNANLSAGYTLIDTPRSLLGVKLQHNSTSLSKPDMSEPTANRRRKLYDQTIGIFGHHRFGNAGTLSADIDYNLAYFNYYGFYAPIFAQPEEHPTPTQTLNNVRFNTAWQSPTEGNKFSWNAALGVDYLSYRSLQLTTVTSGVMIPLTHHLKGEKETDLHLSGGVKYNFNTKSSLHAHLRADYLLYSNPAQEIFTADNYGNINILPGYRFQIKGFNLDLGANIDLTFNAGPKGNRFSTFHIAPALKVDYKAGPAGLYLHALGGTELNTLSATRTLDYYALPAIANTRPVYTPLDARIGANFGSFSGFSAGVFVGYKVSKKQPLAGWYTTWLNNGTHLPDRLSYNKIGNVVFHPDYSGAFGMDVKGFNFGAMLDYRLGNTLHLRAEGSYQPQNGETGWFNGLDRPRWLLQAQASVSPISCLDINVGYEYRGIRNAYLALTRPLFPGMEVDGQSVMLSYGKLRLPDVTNLKVGATWRATSRLAITLQAENLLNRHIEVLPDLKSQGITLLGGFQFLF